jgi:repressor LexA
LKRFYREGNVIRLQPSNTEMSPIYAPAVSVNIQGKVLGVLRKYAWMKYEFVVVESRHGVV